MRTIVIKVLPNPQFKGDWLVECRELLPYGLWYKSREDGISYAKLLSRECNGEVRVFEEPKKEEL
jgi:hypothetical protein